MLLSPINMLVGTFQYGCIALVTVEG